MVYILNKEIKKKLLHTYRVKTCIYNRGIFIGKIAAKAVNNKIVIHGNYVNDEFEVWQRYTCMRMLSKSMFLQNTIEWQKFSNCNIY